jgi:hypothetical protein
MDMTGCGMTDIAYEPGDLADQADLVKMWQLVISSAAQPTIGKARISEIGKRVS